MGSGRVPWSCGDGASRTAGLRRPEGFATYNAHFEISHRKQDEIISEIRRSADRIVGKQDQMLDKQDQTIATIQGCSDKMLDKQDQTTSEVRTPSNNLGDMMNRHFQRIDGEIRLIKDKIGT